jgi:EipB-like
MKGVAGLVSGLAAAAALLAASPAAAQLKPHRAEYSLRLGTALNATRIGSVVQDIELGCDGWRIRRELAIDMSLTPSLKVSITSRMEGEEQRNGNGFIWRAVQVVNGREREVRGTARRSEGPYRVEVATPDGPEQSILPPLTLMPVATLNYLVRRLMAGSDSFPVLMFGAEAAGVAYLVDVKRSDAAQATPPSQRRVKVPGGQSWPLTMTIARTGQGDSKPLLSLRGRIFDSGVLDGLIVDAGVVTVAARLRDLQMREAPTCTGSNQR